MPNQQPLGKRHSRYHDVNSEETRAAFRRNFYLMIAAAVGIALSMAIPRMCPAEPEVTPLDKESAELQRNLESAFTDYNFDVQASFTDGERIRCDVYVIADQFADAPEEHLDALEKAAFTAFGDQNGEVVWRFYRKTPATAGGDPAFIGLSRSDLAELARRFGSTGNEN